MYFNGNMTVQQVADELGYPTRQNLCLRLKKDLRYGGNFKHGFYPAELKIKAVRMRIEDSAAYSYVALGLGVKDASAIINWVKIYRKEGYGGLMPKKKSSAGPPRRKPLIPEEPQELRCRCEELELENDILRETTEILKKDQGAGPAGLSNNEKTAVTSALAGRHSLKALLRRLDIAQSSYYYCRCAAKKTGRHQALKAVICELFKESRMTYGYRRIWQVLRNKGIIISEKVARRLMALEGLAVLTRHKRHCRSYQGEITPAPQNLINRDFSASAPNQKWLTDITEMAASGGKAYLSPVIDCFDGLVVSWTTGLRPNAILVTQCWPARLRN